MVPSLKLPSRIRTCELLCNTWYVKWTIGYYTYGDWPALHVYRTSTDKHIGKLDKLPLVLLVLWSNAKQRPKRHGGVFCCSCCLLIKPLFLYLVYLYSCCCWCRWICVIHVPGTYQVVGMYVSVASALFLMLCCPVCLLWYHTSNRDRCFWCFSIYTNMLKYMSYPTTMQHTQEWLLSSQSPSAPGILREITPCNERHCSYIYQVVLK